jgi:hypothetical protein
MNKWFFIFIISFWIAIENKATSMDEQFGPAAGYMGGRESMGFTLIGAVFFLLAGFSFIMIIITYRKTDR